MIIYKNGEIKLKAVAVVILAVLMSGCATKDIIRADKCQWIRGKGHWTYTHYSKCDNPEHKEWGTGATCLQRYSRWFQDSVIGQADKSLETSQNRSE